LAAIIKGSGLTPAEFWRLPKALTAANSAYMVETHENNDSRKLATTQNVAFIKQHYPEIRRLMASWMVRD
jgi:hypothetical protein